jgi:NAD(P)-dependent dehydrogenase (short-subunit alcohol dehydrogenase family)
MPASWSDQVTSHHPQMQVEGRVAVVTGAAAGIGRAIALRLAAEGAHVVVADIDEASGRRTAAEIRERGRRAAFVRADLGRAIDVRRMVAFAVDELGGLEIMVNNAGVASEPPYPDVPYERWRYVLDVNLIGLMLATQLAIDAMRRHGNGVVLNVSSVAGLGLKPHDLPDYAATKAAIVKLTTSLATLRERMNVRVNAMCPDWVATEANVEARGSMTEEEWRAKGGPERMVPLEEIAEAALMLIRDESLAGAVLNCPCGGEWGLLPLE